MVKRFVKICPRCGSLNWTMVSMKNPGGSLVIHGGELIRSDVFECRDCGYVGTFLEIEQSKVKTFQKTLKKNG